MQNLDQGGASLDCIKIGGKTDALLQKTYTTDFLTKKKKTNEGEVPQYYVTASHEAIIEPEIFDMVQMELSAVRVGHGSALRSGTATINTVGSFGDAITNSMVRNVPRPMWTTKR